MQFGNFPALLEEEDFMFRLSPEYNLLRSARKFKKEKTLSDTYAI
jgi:hypothetical protein